ncbi:glycosyltransferase family 2 protein [Cryobacterium melibiosiphilum]|uniref:Glycosyltransferase family 2 protein n=1 Tax=Cryobacterium melibiosiphilum TaxID=995039 RepID=A0A3A5MQV9_9MICO|nr:glycosyltransferase family 2 protein [Cryobacterium melibiosiphilum]RJT87814.1 glycosyltransferase family 2 protein [Cryobacterium melibiosiphilum]
MADQPEVNERDVNEPEPRRPVALSIDVVVPVYGNWAMTRDCIEHLQRQGIAHTLIIVDDAGPDDTAERLRAEYPHVTLVEHKTNRGFAAACNSGIQAGTGDLVMLVNNDVQADPDMLERLAEAFTANPKLGSAAPLLFQPNGTIDAVGLCADPTLAGFLRFHGAAESQLSADAPALLGPYGAVAAFRRTALTEVGLLDEGIFMYGEELDLALRLSAAGWATTAVLASRGVHLGGATSGRGSAKQRERAGFGRGYLLRAYGVLTTRTGPRALATELIVCVGDLLLSRDLASTRGRLAGWRAGRHAEVRPATVPGLDATIGFVTSLRMRVGDYAAR